MTLKKWLFELKEEEGYEELFHENEIQTNRLGMFTLLFSGIIMIIIVILSLLNIFPLAKSTILPPMIIGLVETTILVGICYMVKNDRWWLKHVLIICMILIFARFDVMLTHKVSMIMAIPVVFSSRYFSSRLTVVTAVVTGILFAISTYMGATTGMIDLNIVTMAKGTTMTATGGFLGQTVINTGLDPDMLRRNAMLYNYVPRMFIFSIISVICVNLAYRGRQLIFKQHEQDIITSRMNTELDIGKRVQINMLPHNFPPFPDRKEFDLYASMEPAKKVGGDFYDFFLVDDNHLVMVIGDVSGKGVPAALFMMTSSLLLRMWSRNVKSPAAIMSSVNNAICSNETGEMFLTAWLGILDIKTGVLTCCNAGHEYPFVKSGNGKFELLKDKHNFILGGMKHMKYDDYEIKMEPGSKVFVYTDGLPESKNQEGDQFGIERAGRSLASMSEKDPIDIIKGVAEVVDEFENGSERFDDLTMLCLQYNGSDIKELPIEATVKNISNVTAFINRKLDETNCTKKARKQIAVVIDELFGNIARYAYDKEGGPATVSAELNEDKTQVTITLRDKGKPFNPLDHDEPDTDATASEREVGGLGIFLVRRMMDEMTYERINDENVLTIKKTLTGE